MLTSNHLEKKRKLHLCMYIFCIHMLLDRLGRGPGPGFDGRGLCFRSKLFTLDISAASSKDLVTVGRVGIGISAEM